MHPSAGTLLGPYEILSAIGAGGIGEVYRAQDTRLDRAVAIEIESILKHGLDRVPLDGEPAPPSAGRACQRPRARLRRTA